MSEVSLLLKQHIGTVQVWISSLTELPSYIRLQQRGCQLYNGVILINDELDLYLTPKNLECEFRYVQNPIPILWILKDYISFLQQLPADMIKHAMELDSTEARLEGLLVREQLFEGGRLWIRDLLGIHEIRVDKVYGYVNPRIDYTLVKLKEQRSTFVSKLAVFSSKIQALDPRKEGHYEFS